VAASKPFVSSSFTYETLEETLDVKPKGTELFIGIPKETSFSENRIALTPEAVAVLVANGHRVIMETKAGEGSSYSDKDYSEAGAKIAYDKKEVYEADILVKSAPVSEAECELLKYGQYIISPIHLAVMKSEILEKMMEKKITALSFENLKDETGHNPIVRSMSEIAGSAVMAIFKQCQRR
jgi:alanine dehydrogenase